MWDMGATLPVSYGTCAPLTVPYGTCAPLTVPYGTCAPLPVSCVVGVYRPELSCRAGQARSPTAASEHDTETQVASTG